MDKATKIISCTNFFNKIIIFWNRNNYKDINAT